MVEQALIDKIVARVVALLRGETVNTAQRNVLLLFSGASTGYVVGMEAIRRLTGAEHNLTVVMTPAAHAIITPDKVRQAGATKIIGPGEWADAPGLVKRTDLVLIPTLSMNLAARLALGLMDSLITTLALGSLLAGKSVVAVKDGADPFGNAGQVFGATETAAPLLRQTLGGHLDTLAAFGIEMVGEADFLFTMEQRLLADTADGKGPAVATLLQAAATAQVANGPKATFVTARDLQGLSAGATLCLAPGSRLTPQAHDVARRLNLTLVE
jgi:hypothetical protein